MSEETKFAALGADYWKARCDEWMAANERLIRERDENWQKYVDANEAAMEAEQRGYRRGVQDAAALARHWLGDDSYCEAAILALLEQAAQSLSPEDKLG